MAEKEQAHRHEVESADSKGSLTLASRGQLIAGGLAVIALLGGLLLVIMNNDVQGSQLLLVMLCCSAELSLSTVSATGHLRKSRQNLLKGMMISNQKFRPS
jgi:hypothetical protein